MQPSAYLIGAGPGDPGLLTLRGAECLGRVEVVLYDGLSNPKLLQHAPQAEWICVGKHGQSRIWTQAQINEEMIRHVRAGRRVARLKGGDPAVFARTAEEIDALRGANIRFEVVPGITAALAAGSYAGIPITHRRFASAVALVTGQEEPGKAPSSLDWEALARFPGTLVVYMGVTTARHWTAALLAAGKPPETPAAILRRCSLPDQEKIICRLDQVADRLTPASKLRPPVIVIVGEVARLASEPCWFDDRPLAGQSVLVTRAEQQAEELAAPLTELGAEVLVQPAIELLPVEDFSELDAKIAAIADYDWLIFTSRNGVSHFLDRMWALGKDSRHLKNVRLAVVGKRTAQALHDRHLLPDLAAGMNAEALATELIARESLKLPHGATPTNEPAAPLAGRRFLWARASRGPDRLAQRLTNAGGQVQQVVAYRHLDIAVADPVVAARLAGGKLNWVTVTSDATAHALVRLFGDSLRTAQIASLSPNITCTLKRLGLPVAAEAAEPTMGSLVTAMADQSLNDPSGGTETSS
ncbi:MAG: uroporphyrinogen-III C-methyltransferase [Planctomycetaceae bacterium]|nr:MAG: uroporphyrinogen-III C-methyltransferase [Planctomycetaceae bacterium]